MKKIAIIGAGTMGNGIAHTFAQSGFQVQLIDISQASLTRGVATITKNESTAYTIQFCKQQKINVLDIGLDLPSEEFSSLPYDIHPNEKAHRIFEKRLRTLF